MEDRIKALIAIGIFMFMSTLDGSIVNIALPTMSKELGVTTSQITWVVTIYLITISSIILIFGRLSDLIGKSKVTKIGWGIFILGSFLCGLDVGVGLPALLFSRIVQALGASMMMATSFGLIAQIFPIESRARAISINAMFVSIGSITGPALGGFILQVTSWHYIFWINIPIGILAWIFGNSALPKDEPQGSLKEIDISGSLQMALSMIFIFLSLNLSQEFGWKNPMILFSFILGFIFFFTFIFTEKRRKSPLLDLNIFKSRTFSLSLMVAMFNFTVSIFSSILLPFYLQDFKALEPGLAGLIMMTSPIAMLIFAPLSGWISDRTDKELVTFIGLTFIIFSQIGYLLINENSGSLHVVITLFIQGMGLGIFQSPNNALVMETVDRKYLGIAGSINALVRNVAFVLGASLATIFLFVSMSNQLGYKVTSYLKNEPLSFLNAFHFVFIIGLTVVSITWLLGLFRLISAKKDRKALKD
ncbi:MAG: MFS transporter [Lactovum sp.]